MMKRLLLGFGLCLASAPAWAACGVTNLQVKDNAAVTAAVPYADDGSGASNCSPQVQIKQGGNVAAVTAGGAIKTDASATTQPVSQATAANLNATVVGTGTFAVQATLAAETTKVIGTVNQGTSPWVTSVSTWAGGTLGAMANYGTSPGAVLVPGINAFVTNSNANGQATMANSSPVVIASNQSAVSETPTAGTAGGATPYTPFVPTASDNHQVVKNGAGTAYWVAVSNNSATKNYVRLYDAGTGFNGCNSATGVIFAFEIPPTDSGFTINVGGVAGLAFTNGLSLCVTSGFGLTDTTNATATAMYVNVGYK